MGMDLHVYKINGFSKNQDSSGIANLLLNEKAKNFFLKNYQESKNFIFDNEYVDLKKVKEDFFKEGEVYDYDFTVNPAWLQYEIVEDGKEITKLIEIENPEKYIYVDNWGIFVDVSEIGYIRKPFRHESTPTKTEGDTVTIYIDNFTGAKEGLEELLGQDAMDNSFLLLTVEDKETVLKLAEYCNDKEYWLKNVYGQLKKDVVIAIDW